MLPSTITVNSLVTGLIAARLLYAHRLLTLSTSDQNSNEKFKSPYIIAVVICIESSVLIVLWAIVSTIITGMAWSSIRNEISGNVYTGGHLIPILIFPQICVCIIQLSTSICVDSMLNIFLQVLSPLLIIFRVAKHRSNDTITTLEAILTRRSIAFRHTQSNNVTLESSA